jgi:hypothetical protein
MATVTIARSDLFPVGTTVGIYPAGAFPPANQTPSAPGAAAIASAAVAANGTLTVTDAGILSYTRYVAAANVGGTWVYARCRSTLDAFDYGRALGTGDTVSGSAALANVVATSAATATGTTVALEGNGAQVPAANLGATAVPSRIRTGWQAQLAQRRSIAGTS